MWILALPNYWKVFKKISNSNSKCRYLGDISSAEVSISFIWIFYFFFNLFWAEQDLLSQIKGLGWNLKLNVYKIFWKNIYFW